MPTHQVLAFLLGGIMHIAFFRTYGHVFPQWPEEYRAGLALVSTLVASAVMFNFI